MRGIREHVPSVAFLGDPARVHHRHAVASLGDDPEVVRYQEQGGPEVLPKVGEDAQDLRLHDHVQGGRRLVRDEELGSENERERDHDPLPHAARELVRILAEACRRDAHPPERLERALAYLLFGEARFVLLERLAEVILDAHERVQPRHGLLEDEAEVRPAQAPELLRRHAHEIPATVEDLPVGDGSLGEQAENAPAERRLPASRLADEAEHLPCVDVERDAVDGAHRAPTGAVVHAQVAHRDDWVGGHGCSALVVVASRSTFTRCRFRRTGLIDSFSPSASK